MLCLQLAAAKTVTKVNDYLVAVDNVPGMHFVVCRVLYELICRFLYAPTQVFFRFLTVCEHGSERQEHHRSGQPAQGPGGKPGAASPSKGR